MQRARQHLTALGEAVDYPLHADDVFHQSFAKLGSHGIILTGSAEMRPPIHRLK
jgi:hypothetical protein